MRGEQLCKKTTRSAAARIGSLLHKGFWLLNLLHIDSSILGANSVSRTLSANIVSKMQNDITDLTVTYRDLAGDPIPHLSAAVLMASSPASQPAAVAADLAVGAAALKEFLSADIVVIGLGFYNFGIPSQLKAWLDRILIVGQTFRYASDGRPEGLAGNKRAILAIARGGFYGLNTPAASLEHAESHLRATLGFTGITQIDVIAAEGIAIGPEQRAASIAAAQAQIEKLAVMPGT